MRIRLQDGTQAQLHDVYDPYSGAKIGARLYAGKVGSRRVSEADVRQTLRTCFTEWGTLPDEVQTDGEPVLVGKAGDDFPTHFTLWLAGLGIVHRVIPPARPTYNGAVERDHRTMHDYSIIGQTHLGLEPLQTHLDEDRANLNARYPSQAKGCAGQPPLLAHPELLAPRRAYHPTLERQRFDLKRVDAHLARLTFARRVSQTGQITLGGQHAYYTLDRSLASQTVHVSFDPTDRTFVARFADAQGVLQEHKRWSARGLSAEEILGPLPEAEQPIPLQLPLPLDFENLITLTNQEVNS